ncbi:MAG: DUF4465 domain-containing protein [Sedimentisphaerales bacterium]|nr:DUF4465 domain-containing protein [Sedimentisphaerales bacterium]
MKVIRTNGRLFVVGVLAVLVGIAAGASGNIATLEELSLEADSFWNGADGTGGFVSGQVFFPNHFQDYGGGVISWDGWACSNMTDTVTAGYENQYSAFAGGGTEGSAQYGVSYSMLDWMSGSYDPIPTRLEIQAEAAECVVLGAYLTNTTYTALAMLEGNGVAKKFGGPDGTDPDWFKLMVRGYDADGGLAGTLEFYLADYRSPDNGSDYVLADWTWMDLSGLGAVAALEFAPASSDVGPFGINTPTYFALDNLVLVPEAGSMSLLALGMGWILRRRQSLTGRKKGSRPMTAE